MKALGWILNRVPISEATSMPPLDLGYIVPHRITRQRGSIAAMSASAVVLMIAFCGLAIELSQVYNRKVELKGIASSAALAAARELNGTADGVDSAVQKARKTLAGSKYGYGKFSYPWSDSVVTFSDSPNSENWLSASEAKNSSKVKSVYFVHINTGELQGDPGKVLMFLMPVLGPTYSNVSLREVAVAGRTSIKVMPIAICAMSNDPASKRTNTVPSGTATTSLDELVQYGFRRGLSYDLMQLNPNGTDPENFIVDPFLAPGVNSATIITSASAVSQFVCTGEMWMPHVMDGQLNVARPFPLGSLYAQLNSRFDMYDSSAPEPERCSPAGAPPDVNIGSYSIDKATNIPWMTKPSPTVQVAGAALTAATGTSGGRLQSNVDLAALPDGQDASKYGPIWSYAKAVPFTQYVAGNAEPASGYTPFLTSKWSVLYKPNSSSQAPEAGSYPSSTPYMNTTTSSEHAMIAERYRRVLNIPLLSCPVPAGPNAKASVAAIGKFFMTVPASSNRLIAEFGGIVPEKSVSGRVELFQ